MRLFEPCRLATTVFIACFLAIPAGSGCSGEPETTVLVVERDPRHPLGHGNTPRTSTATTGSGTGGQNGSASAAKARAPFRPVSGTGYSGFVKRADHADQWQPDDEQIAGLENRIGPSFDEARGRGELADDIDISSYVRQYRGYIKDHVRYIEVRLYCPEMHRWAGLELSIAGGGKCMVFSAYNTNIGEFLYWSTRGEQRRN